MTEKKKLLVLCVALFCFIAVSAQQRMSVSSPDGKLRFSLKVTPESVSYDIDYRKQSLIANSLLGFSFDSGEFGRNLKAGKVQRKKIDETYKLIVGKTSSVRSRCNEMTVPMQERSDSGRLINLVVRAFDDGIAFRYEFPEQKAWDSYVMYDERTQFNLQGNPMALLMYLPGYVNTHEGVYSHVRYDIHLWVHWRPLYDKLEEAFALYEGWGVKGLMVDFMDRNDQEMIRIQEEILECAARHRLFIQFHGSSKPSGLVRTYPNEFTREGTLNYEVCKWDTLVNADHDIAIPFTRMLAGATDYHLGGFRALPRSEFKIQYVNPHVMSTRCHMLAMYVVLENHLTSLCDTPKAYEGQPGFEVLRTVPGTWDEIRVPLAKMNEHVTVARRSGSDWWVGSLNNGAERNLKLELDFLSEGDYQATIYTDAEDVDRNPNHLDRQVRKVTRKDIIELNLAKDGGALLHIRRL